MTRAGGVSTKTSKHTETRGAKNRKGELNNPRDADVGVGHSRDSNQRRSGMVRRPVASGRNGAAGERRRDANSETS